MDKCILQPMKEEDIPALAPIMKKAFDEDGQIHLGENSGPDGYADGSFLRKWGLCKESASYTVFADGVPVGAVILWINHETKENFLGNIFVDPAKAGKGYGKRIWQMVEDNYPDTKTWRTETPGYSRRNHYFYVVKCGFQIVDIKNPRGRQDAVYLLQKNME